MSAVKNLIEKLPAQSVGHGWLILQWPAREIHSFKGESSIFPLSELLYNTAAYLCCLEPTQPLLSVFPTELFTFSQILSLAELVNSLPRCWAQCHKYERKKQFWRKHIWKEEDKIVMARLFLFYQVAVKLPSPEAECFSCVLKKEIQQTLPLSLLLFTIKKKKKKKFRCFQVTTLVNPEIERIKQIIKHPHFYLKRLRSVCWVHMWKQIKKKQSEFKRTKSLVLAETRVPRPSTSWAGCSTGKSNQHI